MNLEEHLSKQGARPALKDLILLLAEKCKGISHSFQGRQHMTESKNIFGEKQAALDRYADRVLIESLKESGMVKTIASEEQPELIRVNGVKEGFGVIFDPIDGCSSIDVNLTVGTIIGIFDSWNVLQEGKNLSAALLVIYGPLTILVYSIGKGVHEFVLDNNMFKLKKENLKIPERGGILASGGLRRDFLPNHEKFIRALESDGYKIRYSGSCVADIYQILYNGGIYCYPKLKGKDKGKLRLLFEAIPLGFIVKQAGGMISDGEKDLLTVKPTSISDRTPLYMGGKKEIKQANSVLAGA